MYNQHIYHIILTKHHNSAAAAFVRQFKRPRGHNFLFYHPSIHQREWTLHIPTQGNTFAPWALLCDENLVFVSRASIFLWIVLWTSTLKRQVLCLTSTEGVKYSWPQVCATYPLDGNTECCVALYNTSTLMYKHFVSQFGWEMNTGLFLSSSTSSPDMYNAKMLIWHNSLHCAVTVWISIDQKVKLVVNCDLQASLPVMLKTEFQPDPNSTNWELYISCFRSEATFFLLFILSYFFAAWWHL